MAKYPYLGAATAALLLMSLAGAPSAQADAPGATMDAQGVVTLSNPAYGARPTGYYDRNGDFNYGWKPYLTGYYDGHGDWHDYPNMEVIGTTQPVPPVFLGEWRYDVDHQNFYAGYGTRTALQRGWTRVVGPDGQPHWVDLRANRDIVHLVPDNKATLYIVSQFEPVVMEIPTGRTVTFVANEGHYALAPEYDSYWSSRLSNRFPAQFIWTVPMDPDHVFSWTFTQPGIYKVTNATGGGPSDCHFPGLIIKVVGDAVPWDESAFVCWQSYTMKRLPYTYTASVWQPMTLPTTNYTPPPPQPPPPHKVIKKKVPRNKDIK
ncbi:MAG TPA: hypothetical protein VGO93_06740 [Candidatus Xenobia bacterium]